MSWKSIIWNGLLVAAVCLAVFLLYRIFQQYSLDEIVQSVRSIPFLTFCTALLFTAASYLCLSCFDLLAIRSLGKSCHTGTFCSPRSSAFRSAIISDLPG